MRLPSRFLGQQGQHLGRARNASCNCFLLVMGKKWSWICPACLGPETPKEPHFPKVTPGRVSITAMNELQRITPLRLSYRARRSLVKTQKAMRLARPRQGGKGGGGALVTCTLDLCLKRGSEVGKVDDDPSARALIPHLSSPIPKIVKEPQAQVPASTDPMPNCLRFPSSLK